MVLVELMVRCQADNIMEHFRGNQRLPPPHHLLHHNFTTIQVPFLLPVTLIHVYSSSIA